MGLDPPFLADIICEKPLIKKEHFSSKIIFFSTMTLNDVFFLLLFITVSSNFSLN